ncbi:MAG TPA: NAD-dependent malic enzyme [Phycisphaerales bacterium]|nr:NAD-dependent malic enzyme [Phycisphaerales bacterium]
MQCNIKIDPVTGEKYLAVLARGRQILREPLYNKGTAFTYRERDELSLHGLLPPGISSIKKQLDRNYENYLKQPTDLAKYVYLNALHERNEVLFYRLISDHLEEMMPIVYTPVVGEACQNFSHTFRSGRGIYIAYEQKNEIEHILINSGHENPSIIVVTDGERILGLGDQGIGGMGIPIGKLALYTLCAGISPFTTLPIILDTGTDNEEALNDPLYLGMKHRRIRGKDYQDFIDRFIDAVKKVYPHVILQWEDFLKGNALFQLARFRDNLCTFNDDIQGTASITVAGLISALRITKQPMREQKVVFAGAGAAAQGISDLIVTAMMEDGLSRQEAVRRILTVDRKGLVSSDREGLEDFKATFAQDRTEREGWKVQDPDHITLEETVINAKPTILIGTSGTPGLFSEKVVRAMAKVNERPIIFPLSNPTSKTECTPKDAILWSEGRVIIATGSPFEPIDFEGRRYKIGQCNNAYIFPGIGLGLIVSRSRRVSDAIFLAAAKALANLVTESDLSGGALFPELTRIRECSHAIACATARQAVLDGIANNEILDDLEKKIKQAMWEPEYLPLRYESGPVVYREVARPPLPIRIKGQASGADPTTDRILEMTDFLREKSDDLLTGAISDLHRAHLQHYEADGLQVAKDRLATLLDRTLVCLETGRAEPLIDWAERTSRERHSSGFDLFEVQTSINVIEEAIWQIILSSVKSDELAHSLGLANTLLSMAKDKLAQEYIKLESQRDS